MVNPWMTDSDADSEDYQAPATGTADDTMTLEFRHSDGGVVPLNIPNPINFATITDNPREMRYGTDYRQFFF